MAGYVNSHTMHRPDLREVVSLIGRAMITLGLVLLLFVAYQLWGTNFFEARSQKTLRGDFTEKLKKAEVKDAEPAEDPTVATAEELAQLNQETTKGQPIAVIEIPKIGLNHIVVSGTDKGSLQKGPGHYPTTPLPGQLGNAAIAGHRTTYGAPFGQLHELVVGDKIILVTLRGKFTYEVTEGNKIVSPKDVGVINPVVDPADPTGATYLPTLTLTTCHPKFSAAQRLIVHAKLVPADVDRATEPSQLIDPKTGKAPTKIDIGEDSDTQNASDYGQSNILLVMLLASLNMPLLKWFLLLLAVGSLWWYLFNRFHNWKMWAAGILPFAFVLLLYFINLEHALPSSL